MRVLTHHRARITQKAPRGSAGGAEVGRSNGVASGGPDGTNEPTRLKPGKRMDAQKNGGSP